MNNNFDKIKSNLSFYTSLKKTVLFEYKAIIQNRSQIYSAILEPIIYYLFIIKGLSGTIGDISYKGTLINYTLYGLTGMMGIICVGEMTNVVYRTMIDNKWGLLHMKLLNGVKIIPYCIGKSFYAFVGVNIKIPLLIIIYLITGSKINFINIFSVYVCCMIIMLFWSNLGIMIALKVTSYRLRDIILSVLLIPLYFSAPTYYILDDAPSYVNFIAHINPLTYQLNGLREVVLLNKMGINFTIMTAMTIIILIINLFLLKNIKYNRSEM